MIRNLPQSLIDTAKKILLESIEHPMIDVDGEMKHRHNSNGQPIHHTDEGIKNFHRWFGNGQVDEHGRPQVFYHGTPSQENISSFIPGGKDSSERTGDAYGVATYLTTSKHEASSYSKNKGAVYPLYVKGKFLDLDKENLDDDDSHRLSKFANDQLLPSEKSRFSPSRKTRTFQPHELESANEFFENKRKDYEHFGDGYDRNFPTVDKDGDNFLISYTDYDAPVSIKSGHDAHTLLKATGFDNVPALGYDGVKMKMDGGKTWIVNHRPNHTIKSALGNTGEFKHPDNINESADRDYTEDEHGKAIVYDNGEYKISVNNPHDASFIALWHSGKKVGEMHLGKGRTSDTEGYATIRSVDIDKAHRGQGMGHQLYKTALKYVHEKYKGIGSEQPDRINKKQVPSILRRMGGVNHESGDITIDRNQQ